MGSRVINYIALFFKIFVFMSNKMVDPVNGQCTVQGCEKGELLNEITAEIQEIRDQQDIIISNLRTVDRRSQEQIRSIYEFLNMSYQQMKNQHSIVMLNFQAIDRRLEKQDANIKRIGNNHEILNASHQEIKNLNETLKQIKDQQDIAVTNLHAVDQRSQEQSQSIKFVNTSIQQMGNQQETVLTSLRSVERRSQEQIQSISAFFNTSFQQIGNLQETVLTSLRAVELRSQEQSVCLNEVQSISEFLNASFQQTQNQQVSAMTSLVAIDRRLNEHDIFVRDETEIILEQTKLKAIRSGDWMAIMNRFDGSLDFNRSWTEYRNGFGDRERGEFWLGNEKLHRLTRIFNCTLRIEVLLGRWDYAEYSTFYLESENNRYTIHVSGYSGNARDGLTNSSAMTVWHVDGMSFSTSDRDNDRWSDDNCAERCRGGWWYNGCFSSFSCLTCDYQSAFWWYYAYSDTSSGGSQLTAARMMIKIK